jgi:hypothetical protein
MQYKVSITTTTKDTKLITFIHADNLPDAENIIKGYNLKHPDWNMQLLQTVGHPDSKLMPIEYI